MTSKNSFWVDIRENNKRRSWIWAISWLFFLLYYIVGCALTVSNQKSYMQGFREHLPAVEIKRIVMEAATAFLNGPVVLFLAAAGMAVLCGIQGFSYLYQRSQVDLYHSLPVKKSRRFMVIWLNSIFIYLIPSLTGMLGGILVAAVQGAMDWTRLSVICLTYVTTLILYIGLYNLTVIAVMLTGHINVTICGVIVLQSYELLVRLLLGGYMEIFFEKRAVFSGSNWGRGFPRIWLSPYWTYWACLAEMNRKLGNWVETVMFIGQLLFLGVLFGAVGYWLYRKRPSEAAGRAMAFEITKPVVKVGIVVPAVMATALFIKESTSRFALNTASGNPWFIAFAMVISAVIGCCLMEVIYESDIKACLRGKKYILICGGLAALVFLGFQFDVTGYDAYIPDPAKVESYAIVLNNGSSQFFDQGGSYLTAAEYIGEHMFMTDAQSVCRLAAIQPEKDPDEAAQVKYRLKNGRTVEREIWLNYSNPETDEILNRIVSNPEYQQGASMVMADYFDKWISDHSRKEISAKYKIGAYSYKVPEEAMAGLAEAYRRDLEFINYTDITRTIPAGVIEITWTDRNNGYSGDFYGSYGYIYSYYYQMWIYPDCVQTVACLKELELYREVPAVEDIERIEVVNYNNAGQGSEEEWQLYYPGYVIMDTVSQDRKVRDKSMKVSYTDPGEIWEVVQVIAPVWYFHDNRYQAELFDMSYEVTVYFKRGTNPYENDAPSAGYWALKGKMPFFVREATKYIEE